MARRPSARVQPEITILSRCSTRSVELLTACAAPGSRREDRCATHHIARDYSLLHTIQKATGIFLAFQAARGASAWTGNLCSSARPFWLVVSRTLVSASGRRRIISDSSQAENTLGARRPSRVARSCDTERPRGGSVPPRAAKPSDPRLHSHWLMATGLKSSRCSRLAVSASLWCKPRARSIDWPTARGLYMWRI